VPSLSNHLGFLAQALVRHRNSKQLEVTMSFATEQLRRDEHMNHRGLAEEALKQLKFEEIEVSIPPEAEIDSRNNCGFYIEVRIKLIKDMPQSKMCKFVEEALRKIIFPRDSDGYDEVTIGVNPLHRSGRSGTSDELGVIGEMWIQYSWTAVQQTV
jgi:hypothetical protein